MRNNLYKIIWLLSISLLIASCTPPGTPTSTPTKTSQPTLKPQVVAPTEAIPVEATLEPEATEVVVTATEIPVDRVEVKPQLEATANLNCRKFPLNTARILGHAVKGTTYDVLGKDVSETWYLIPNPQKANESVCWVFAADTQLLDESADLTILSATTR